MSVPMPPVLLVGGGKMGHALAQSWQEVSTLTIVEPDRSRADFLRQHLVIDVWEHPPTHLTDGPWVVVFAVKPGVMKPILAAYRHLAATGRCLFVSVAAGYPLISLKAGLGDQARVLRVMPNTPVAVGRGMSVGCAGPNMQATDYAWIESLFGAVGEFMWAQDEEALHAITAVSGSGPAYLFLLAEILTQIGIRLGIDASLSEKLARTTLSGAGELLHRHQEPAQILRRDVTSPGGVTEVALKHLQADDRLAALFSKALSAAAQHSRNMERDVSKD